MKTFLKKYFSVFFIISFFFLLSLYNSQEYLDFYRDYKKTSQEQTVINDSIKNFSLEDIRDLESVEFYYTPYKPLLDSLVEKIDNSTSRVYVEVYMLTEKRIQQALLKAYKRGVDVKVVLEKNPYMAYSINNKAYDLLSSSGVDIVWSNTHNFSLNHTKMIIIDDLVVLSTGNLTYSSFAYNRDMFLFIEDDIILEKLLSVFDYDFTGNLGSVYEQNLLLSPDYSRDKIEALFRQTTSSLDVYFPYLKDDEMFELLSSRLSGGIDLSIVMSQDSLEDNQEEIKKLKNLGANVSVIKSPKIHSKAVLVDKKYLFIGSINFSSYSFDENREIGILLKDKEVIEKFINLFKKDISN